mmetsp:Transcript_16689/g.31570  ORF Transcript_16689/g.31570 Transcript_16689/m.31570 type:complete len:203 (-) Transcript_16689:134-742(-)
MYLISYNNAVDTNITQLGIVNLMTQTHVVREIATGLRNHNCQASVSPCRRWIVFGVNNLEQEQGKEENDENVREEEVKGRESAEGGEGEDGDGEGRQSALDDLTDLRGPSFYILDVQDRMNPKVVFAPERPTRVINRGGGGDDGGDEALSTCDVPTVTWNQGQGGWIVGTGAPGIHTSHGGTLRFAKGVWRSYCFQQMTHCT